MEKEEGPRLAGGGAWEGQGRGLCVRRGPGGWGGAREGRGGAREGRGGIWLSRGRGWGLGGPGRGLALGRRLGRRRQGWSLTLTGHAISSEPEARSAGAQEAAHGVMAGVVTDSPLQRPPTLVYICRRASLPTAALLGRSTPSSNIPKPRKLGKSPCHVLIGSIPASGCGT